jgi:glyoxylase-like metal-dependent hydrolase (beta-lactamase superfamily II)
MESVKRLITSAGRRIYSFPVQAFPALIANIYIISDGNKLTMVDCGSGMEQSNRDLLAGFEAIRSSFGEAINLTDLDAILISHGHIDHFGGLPFVREHTQAPIGVHTLDRRVLSNYEERLVVASGHLESFLQRAGVETEQRANLMAMYLFAKDVYKSTAVQFPIGESEPVLEDFQAYHVPGHCPGQVCLKVDDILLTADHVLSRTTPHQAPESITNNMGLGHYLDSLAKIQRLNGVRMALGGHEDPIPDLQARIQDIIGVHEDRLTKVLEICRDPKSTAGVSQELFGQVSSYHVLLALEEAGAHIEYLYQRGELVAANLEEIESSPQPVIQYQCC